MTRPKKLLTLAKTFLFYEIFLFIELFQQAGQVFSSRNKMKLFFSGIFSIFQQPSHAGHHIPGANYAPAARVAA
jgi:hypothetical protein